MTETPARPTDHPAFAAALEPLLRTQRQRLRRRYLWHGLGLCVLAPAAAILLFFALDRTLRLPLPIRLFHATATAALLGAAAWRYVRYPLTRRFGRLEVAEVLERSFPALHQRLVSAVQLQDLPDAALRNQSRPMIDRLLEDTAAAVRALPLEQCFDRRRTRLVHGAAALLLAVLAGGALWSPPTAAAFVRRHLGLAADYPRDTRLTVELPPAGPELQRTDAEGRTELVLPAGADLHVSVLAEGVVPKEVLLQVQPQRDGAAGEAPPARAVPMAPRPGNRFRHVFRRLSGSFVFHASGGDDDRGDREVVVRTVHPPQVATLLAAVRPPAYTGTGVVEQPGGAIEALVGSEVELRVTTTAAVQRAAMVFLESGRRLDLQPTTVQDDSGVATVYRGQFAIEAADRYQIELFGDTGLRNPNPGTYPIAALQDYAPVGRWLLPDDEGLLLLPEALLCLRFEARDDFGLRAVELAVDRAGARTLAQPLLPADGDRPRQLLRTELFEVKALLGSAPVGSDGLSLGLLLRDNREPQPGQTELPRRLVQIVDAPQLAAAIGRAFRGLREEAGQALEVQADRRARLLDLLQQEPGEAELGQQLTGIEVGQSRIASAAERLHRGLMRAFDLHLWNRLEQSQHAAAVVDLYREFSRGLREPVGLSPEFYRDLQARRAAGQLGAMEKTLDPILQMIGLADRLAAEHGPAAQRALAEAQVARDAASRRPLLQRAAAAQEQAQAALQQLLLRLEEWNDYQDLVQEARALRDRQRDVQQRTEELKGKQ